mmetsp:Transcript_44118/g.88630  ORF Transcript_44118/g.88630 Transcript_44118/m.88630 type:complete len:228 (-) Transcript_44118:37-720(-)
MSAQPSNFCFFSALHTGRVTPAELHMITRGPPRLDAPSLKQSAAALIPAMSTDSWGWNCWRKAPKSLSTTERSEESEKPVAHQTNASAPEHAVWMADSSRRSHSTISRSPLSGSLVLARAASRTSALTATGEALDSGGGLRRAETTLVPRRPVAPATTTVGREACIVVECTALDAARWKGRSALCDSPRESWREEGSLWAPNLLFTADAVPANIAAGVAVKAAASCS